MFTETAHPGTPYAPIFGSLFATGSMLALITVLMPSISAMM